MHPFDEAIRLEPMPDGSLRGHTSELYWNFVGPYGGITAATMLQGLLVDARRLGEPVQLTVNFAAPLTESEFRLKPRLQRTNRNSQHWSIDLLQGESEEAVISALAMFANRRDTWSVTDAEPPAMPAPETCKQAVLREGMAWPKMYALLYPEWRFGQDNPESYSKAWVRDATPRTLDFASLTSICDSFFPRLFLRRPQFVPIGTVSMNVYFHSDAQALADHGEAHLACEGKGQIYSRGFFDQEARVWGRNAAGAPAPLATTQKVVYKE
ncbi:MAG: thioesterase family protein [Candidatus Protistobacter heckmanni]|nr:thioesterase family protein [Candidatus Protistobacter heckmanni]